jgi:capsular polysaccharide biosynthesis protein
MNDMRRDWKASLRRPERPRRTPATLVGKRGNPRPQVDSAGRLVGLTSLLGTPGQRSIAILAHPQLRQAVGPWLAEFTEDQTYVIAPEEAPEWGLGTEAASYVSATGLSNIARELKRLGSIDVIVNLLPDELLPDENVDQYDVFARLFYFVNQGGAFILDRAVAPASSGVLGLKRWFEILAAAEDPALQDGLGTHDTELARSIGTVLLSADLIVATKRLRHYLKLSEAEIDSVLPAREPALEVSVIERHGGGSFTSRARVTFHGQPPVPAPWENEIIYPAVTVRHYRGEIASAGATLMWSGSTVLPDSFRRHLSRKGNPNLVWVDKEFGRIESRFLPKERLAGTYYTLDNSYSGHFGHLTTEVISRLWGWETAKRDLPDLKALVHMKPKSGKIPQLERQIFSAYGIEPEDLVWVNQPKLLESVVSASPMWHMENPHFAHPELKQIWERLTRGLLQGAPPSRTHERLFVSRGETVGKRVCRNGAQLEDVFADHGFHVIFPEELSLATQVDLFAGAKVVAGYAGSALFNVQHCEQLETMIVLSSNSYTARNEHLFASIQGGDLIYFYSDSDGDLGQSSRGWSKEEFLAAAGPVRAARHVDWEFDFARHGDTLVQVLKDL